MTLASNPSSGTTRASTGNHKTGNLTQSHINVMKCEQDGLKCLYTNANSLINKMDELRHRAEEMDIIAVTETWATAEITDRELDIEGYIMYRRDRQQGKGGGVISTSQKGLLQRLTKRAILQSSQSQSGVK